MGLFGKLLGLLTSRPMPPPSSPATPARHEFSIIATVTGSDRPTPQVSNAEIAERSAAHTFVLAKELGPLKTADQWWEEKTHKRRVRDGSDKVYSWLYPFVSPETAKLEQLKAAYDWGPHGAGGIAKLLRALIRERRKSKQTYIDLLRGLYGACAIADLMASLSFEGMPAHSMTQYVDVNDLLTVDCRYEVMGYQCSDSLSKTDVKWLIEAFGEPSEHQSFDAMWPNVRRNAVARYCWSELRSSNETSTALGIAQKSMQDWLNELVNRNIGYDKEWRERVAARAAQVKELSATIELAWAATNGSFVVADLETTGLNIGTDEVLEFAALLVEPTGIVTSEFSTLVRVNQPIPDFITRLTGIAQSDVDREGRSLSESLSAFLGFVGSRPVFFHNAPFDLGFLKSAEAQTKQKLTNQVHDTLPIVRAAWPSLGTYKLNALARHIGVPTPTHRALADAKATLAVLLAARACKVGQSA